MPDRVYNWTFTVSAGTPQSAPSVFSMAVAPVEVLSIVVRVPPGPRGAVGFLLRYGGDQIYPHQNGQYLILDGDQVSFVPPADSTAGSWQLQAYNTGAFAHTLQVTMTTAALGAGVTGPPVVEPVYIE